MTDLESSERTDIVNRLADLLADCRFGATSPLGLSRRWQEMAADVALVVGGRTVGAMPENVLGEPAPLNSPAFHAECLSTIDWQKDSIESVPLKVLYHLLMLGHCLAPTDERFYPLVSVIIPVFNGQETIERAIASCVAQSHPNIEVIVIDDGSTDNTANIVSNLAPAIRLVTQENAGVAAARNRGMDLARGDFLHFLDADDELLPTAIADKLAALSQVADARLCYSHYLFSPSPPGGEGRGEGSTSPSPLVGECRGEGVFSKTSTDQFPLDDPKAATGDPMLAACVRFPFQASTVLVATWFARQVGHFETDLKQSEDIRYWFRMARAGLKAIAVAEPKTMRRHGGNSLTSQLVEAIRWSITADLRSIQELSRSPRLYRYIVPLLGRINGMIDLGFDAGMPQPELDEFHERTLEIQDAIGSDVPSAGGLTAILLDQLLLAASRRRPLAPKQDRPTLAYWDEREDRIRERLQQLPRVTASDLRRWLPDLFPRPFSRLARSEQLTLNFALEQLQVSAVLGELNVRFGSLAQVGAAFPGHPYDRYWRGLAQLSRLIGDKSTLRLARRDYVRNGWQLLGKARRLLRSV